MKDVAAKLFSSYCDDKQIHYSGSVTLGMGSRSPITKLRIALMDYKHVQYESPSSKTFPFHVMEHTFKKVAL